MFRAAPSWLRYRLRLPRLVAVALALACQIGAGAVAPMQAAAEAQAHAQAGLVASVAIFCQSGTAPARHDHAPLHRQVPDHALCQVLSTHGHAVAVLEDAPFLPPPAAARIGGGTLPGARAPPARAVVAAFPRGPPTAV